MNSEFPMTFVDSGEPTKTTRAQPSNAPSQPRKRRSAEQTEARRGPSRNVIPLSDASFTGLSDNATASSPSAPRQALYPMSEFDDLDGELSTQRHPRSPMQRLLRLTLIATLAGLWVAIGLGKLHSDVAFVTETRAALMENIPALAGFLDISNAPQSEHDPVNPSLLADEENSSVSGGADEILQSEATNPVSLNESSESLEQSENGPESAVAASDASAQIAAESRSTASQSLELMPMLELFLEQERQMQKMESHMIELVGKSGNREQLNQFLGELKKRHQSALEMIEKSK